MRLDTGGGHLSDAFRVNFKASSGPWQDVFVEDLKEQLLSRHASLLQSATPSAKELPLAWVYLVLPLREGPPGTSEAPAEKTLSASDTLGSLPAGAGEADWHLVVRIVPLPAAGVKRAPKAAPAPAVPKGPLTLHDRGIADEDEPEQIKNAIDLRELYPGGVLPRSGPNEFNLEVAIKLVIIFFIVVAVGTGVMYFLGEVLPTWLPPVPNPVEPGFGRFPDSYGAIPKVAGVTSTGSLSAAEAVAAAGMKIAETVASSAGGVTDESGFSSGMAESTTSGHHTEL